MLTSIFTSGLKGDTTRSIDAHGLKIQGRGYLMFFAKIPRGVKGFRKN
jgi:hypothetical protein